MHIFKSHAPKHLQFFKTISTNCMSCAQRSPPSMHYTRSCVHKVPAVYALHEDLCKQGPHCLCTIRGVVYTRSPPSMHYTRSCVHKVPTVCALYEELYTQDPHRLCTIQGIVYSRSPPSIRGVVYTMPPPSIYAHKVPTVYAL